MGIWIPIICILYLYIYIYKKYLGGLWGKGQGTLWLYVWISRGFCFGSWEEVPLRTFAVGSLALSFPATWFTDSSLTLSISQNPGRPFFVEWSTTWWCRDYWNRPLLCFIFWNQRHCLHWWATSCHHASTLKWRRVCSWVLDMTLVSIQCVNQAQAISLETQGSRQISGVMVHDFQNDMQIYLQRWPQV